MGRINYTFNGKYLLQASYGPMVPHDSLRAVNGIISLELSAGWRIMDESFMSNVKFVSDLKLRASYGVVGNTSVAPYQTAGILQKSVYSWDEVDAAGFALFEIPNPDLGWEKSATVDIGLDFGLFNGRLSGTFDVYETNTTDLLLRRALPSSGGYDLIFQNIGDTRTRGFELTLNANIIDSPGGFQWDADFNMASYKESIQDLGLRDAEGNIADDVGNTRFIGEPIRVFLIIKK